MLILPIKKKWFDMILSGEKKEEYREIKPYYMSRFKNEFDMYPYSYNPQGLVTVPVLFRNGYGKKCPGFVAICSLEIKTGKEEWGAEPGKEYYVLKIHEIKSVANLPVKNIDGQNFVIGEMPEAHSPAIAAFLQSNIKVMGNLRRH